MRRLALTATILSLPTSLWSAFDSNYARSCVPVAKDVDCDR